MSSPFPRILILLLVIAPLLGAQPPLKVCADPNNLPFSNSRGQGFENKLAALVAHALNRKLQYRWQRHTGRGFVRNILNEGECDLLMGVPSGFKPVLTTQPYYRSSYVFVSRNSEPQPPASLDDPRLRSAKIGVQVVEEEYAPPAIALGRRGLIANIVGYEAVGSSAEDIVKAVAERDVDLAIVWGPIAGFHSKRYPVKITVGPAADGPSLPLAFSISMGVRKTDSKLRDQVDTVLREHRSQIESILHRFGVPQLRLVEELASR